MTPIINDLVRLALKGGTIWDGNQLGFPTAKSLICALADAKTFMVEGCSESWKYLDKEHRSYTDSESYIFSPAPKAWIEFSASEFWLEGHRSAYLLTERTDGGLEALVVIQKGGRRGQICVAERIAIRRANHALELTTKHFNFTSEVGSVEIDLHTTTLKWALSLINLPVGVRAEEVGAGPGYHRKAATVAGRSAGTVYTKITLDKAALSSGSDGDGGSESKRRFHFCRAYIRTRRSGRQEHVRAHWRGDEGCGRVESRYYVGPAAREAA